MNLARTVYVTCKYPVEIVRKFKNRGVSFKFWDSNDPITREELVKQVKTCDGLVCLLSDSIDRDLLSHAGDQLKVVSTMSVGFDHVDTATLSEKNIRLGNTPDVLTQATSEIAIGLLLMTMRRFVENERQVRDGKWKNDDTSKASFGWNIMNRTVGIVGAGRIGKNVAKILLDFDVKEVIFTGRPSAEKNVDFGGVTGRRLDFGSFLAESDIVIVCCALTEGTKDLFNREAFSKMKPNAVFINVARGAIVDHEALYEALKSRTIAAAGLDVTVPEPLNLDSGLLVLNNCTILPHIGSSAVETRHLMAEMALENAVLGVTGKPLLAEVVL